MDKQSPKVSIIILNWNGLKDTVECLESLKKINYSNFEIFIVDNASQKNEAQELKEKYSSFMKIIANQENTGFAKGNNIGIKAALQNTDYILMLNNDTIVKPDFLDHLINAQADIAGPKILEHSSEKISFCGGNIYWFTRFIAKHHLDPLEKNQPFPFLTGCCLLIKKNVFEKIGFLDEKFFLYYEDVDFCLRAKKADFKIILVPQSIIWHKISQSVEHKSKAYYYYTHRNKLLFVKKHAPILAKPYHYLGSLISLIYIKIKPSSERLTAVKEAIRDFWGNKFYKKI